MSITIKFYENNFHFWDHFHSAPYNLNKNCLNIWINCKMRVAIQALKVIRIQWHAWEGFSYPLAIITGWGWLRPLTMRPGVGAEAAWGWAQCQAQNSVSADSRVTAVTRDHSVTTYPGWHNSGADITPWSHWPHVLSNFIVEVGTVGTKIFSFV